MAKNKKVEKEMCISKVMTTLNAHNADLVRKINDLFSDLFSCANMENRLKSIMYAIAMRDKEEIRDTLNVDVDLCDEHDIMNLAGTILTNICDDADLQIIIDFCRFDMELFRKNMTTEMRRLLANHKLMFEVRDDIQVWLDVDDTRDYQPYVLENIWTYTQSTIMLTCRNKTGKVEDFSLDKAPLCEVHRLLELTRKNTPKEYKVEVVVRGLVKALNEEQARVKAMEMVKINMKDPEHISTSILKE